MINNLLLTELYVPSFNSRTSLKPPDSKFKNFTLNPCAYESTSSPLTDITYSCGNTGNRCCLLWFLNGPSRCNIIITAISSYNTALLQDHTTPFNTSNVLIVKHQISFLALITFEQKYRKSTLVPSSEFNCNLFTQAM